MTAIDFPPSPSPGATHADAGLLWRFDGSKWTAATTFDQVALLPAATLVVAASTVLPAGFTGTVLVEQSAPLTITLPSSPVIGQAVTVKDSLGQAATYAISVVGVIEGVAGVTLDFPYGWVSLVWAGPGWVQV